MYIPRSITAELEERLLFNFRVAPEELATQLPVPWLTPLVINGSSVLSFCILHLKNVTLWPLPGSVIGWKTISCAYRCGILDSSGGSPQPAVWIIDRLSDLSVISPQARQLCSAVYTWEPLLAPSTETAGKRLSASWLCLTHRVRRWRHTSYFGFSREAARRSPSCRKVATLRTANSLSDCTLRDD